MNYEYSFIIPVYNRPNEIQELLDSFTKVEGNDEFEIIIVEDGSDVSSEQVVKAYKGQLQIQYFYKPNTGPGDSRNFGMRKARSDYFIILDSDCIIPPHYYTTVKNYLEQNYTDCYGGADAAHESFTPLQKAINYSMTSLFTTGGIRGNKKSVQKFEPRSFNMGISKKAFESTGGFAKIHPGEDPDLSQRIIKAGFKTQFIPNAYVYHKRRISWSKFHTQVSKFGMVRPILTLWHPESAKPTFWFPTLFVFFTIGSIILSIFYSWWFILPLALYMLLIFIDSSIKNKSPYVGLLTLIAVFVQFFGYGMSFLKSTFTIGVLKKQPETAFPKLFFR